MVVLRPCLSGNPRWVRLSAWIWLFPLTDNTMARAGGDQLRWTVLMRKEYEQQHFAWGFLTMPEKGNMNYEAETDNLRAGVLSLLNRARSS